MAEAGTFPVHTVLRILAMHTETMGTGGNIPAGILLEWVFVE